MTEICSKAHQNLYGEADYKTPNVHILRKHTGVSGGLKGHTHT